MSVLATRRGNEPRHIQTRRAEADRLVDAHKLQRQDFALAHKAKWTNRTEATIERNQIKTLTRAMAEDEQKKLALRRQRLSSMFAEEESRFKAEIDAMVESSADRAKRLIVHARARKDDREQKRQAFADEMMKAQWREGCDDLRTIGSQMAEKHTAKEVAKQMTDNVERNKATAAENARYDALWEAQRQLKNKQADEEEARKQNYANHIKQALTEQVQEARQRKLDDARRTEEEKIAFQARLEADERAAQERQAQDAHQKRLDKAALARENEEFLAARRDQKQKEKDAEKKLIEQVLAAHRQETHQKLIDKRALRVERLEYMDFLRQRREEERKLEQQLEAITQAALDRDNQKRDMIMLKEELARAELAKQVQMARRDQLDDKKGMALRRQKELSLEKQLMERELTLYKQRQAHEADEERLKAAQRKHDLEKQIETNQARRDVLHAKTEQEYLDAKRAEAEYAAFVAQERADPTKLLRRGDYRRKKDGYAFGLYS